MPHIIAITAIAALSALAVTGTLFPAVESLADYVVSAMSGHSVSPDFAAKFVRPPVL